MGEVVLPGESVRLVTILVQNFKLNIYDVDYQGRCFGRPDVRGGIDVRIVPEGHDFYKGASKECADWTRTGPQPGDPVWMSDYDTAMIYSKDYAMNRWPPSDAADDKYIVHFETNKDLVLFDLLSERNIRMLLEHFKGDRDLSEIISNVTGIDNVHGVSNQLSANYVRYFYAPTITPEEVSDINEKYAAPAYDPDAEYVQPVPYDGFLDLNPKFSNSIVLQDSCGMVHKAGLDGGFSRYSERDLDVKVVNAIKKMCEDLQIEVHGWHQSETLSQSGGHFKPEVALFSMEDLVEADCDVPRQLGGGRKAAVPVLLACVTVVMALLQG